MKFTSLIFFVVVFLLGGIFLRAEDWTTIDGKVYPEIKVVRVDLDAVTILYRDGGVLIPLIKLPDNLQQEFHYDASIARAAADARDLADFENARALREEYRQIIARKMAALIAENVPATPSDTDSSIPVEYTDSSHHSMSDLINPNHRLRDDVSMDHHYSMGSLFGHGDPLHR